MRVTYIGHSGFAVEMEEHILLFDYYEGEIPVFDKNKQLIVFASHFHQDHFNRKVLEMERMYPQVQYVFSKDIHIRKEERRESMHFMRKQEEAEISGCRIRTLRSTDEGVAYLVLCEGRTIYHAGDLNWWHWEEESDAYNQQMKLDYQKEVESLADTQVDLAFLVLDPRQGEQYFWGMDWFMRHVDVRQAFPMHMWEEYEVFDRLMEQEESVPYRNRIRRISRQGEVFIC